MTEPEASEAVATAPERLRANALRALLLEQAARLAHMAEELQALRRRLPTADAQTSAATGQPSAPDASALENSLAPDDSFPPELAVAAALDEAIYQRLPSTSRLLVEASLAVPDDPIEP
jgi:hypothetical protein